MGVTSRKKLSFNWRKWCDEFVLASKGVLLATKEKRFWAGFVPAFLLFGVLINLLVGGFSKFELMGAVGFSGSMKIILDAFLAVFGVNMVFAEWIPIFLLALLQGVLIGLIVLLWQKKRVKSSEDTSNSANIEKVGIITGLIALGAGCPTCGTTLLTPLLGAIFSTGSLTMVGVLSNIVTCLAVLIAVLSLKRIGEETYVIIVNERYLKKKEECEKSS